MEGRAGTFEQRRQIQNEGPRPPSRPTITTSIRTFTTGLPDVNAAELRRARLGVEGVLFYDWHTCSKSTFANDVTAIKDAYVQYQGFRL